MKSNITCPACNEKTLIAKERDIITYWGNFQVELKGVPTLTCSKDNEYIFDMNVARFTQLLTRFLSEKAPYIKIFSVKNLNRFFTNRKIQNDFFSALDSTILKENQGVYYLTDLDLILLNEKMTMNTSLEKETLEEFQLAARDAKIENEDILKMMKHLKNEGNDE